MRALDTAAAIARVRAEEGDLPEAERLFDDPFAHLFEDKAKVTDEVFALIPFFREHIRLRTRFIDDFVRGGIASGARQLVLLGAGFDCRPLRLKELVEANTLVAEVDLLEQLDRKRDLLEAAGSSWPERSRAVPVDLSEPEFETALGEGLGAAGLDRAVPSVFVAEGLIGYLARDPIERLLRLCREHAATGSRIVLTYHRTAWDEALVAEFLERSGWHDVAAPSFEDLHREHFGAEPPEGIDRYRLTTASVR